MGVKSKFYTHLNFEVAFEYYFIYNIRNNLCVRITDMVERYCTNCGNTTKTKICPHCGWKIYDGHAICEWCGYECGPYATICPNCRERVNSGCFVLCMNVVGFLVMCYLGIMALIYLFIMDNSGMAVGYAIGIVLLLPSVKYKLKKLTLGKKPLRFFLTLLRIIIVCAIIVSGIYG